MVSIILPAYNEEKIIGKLIDDIESNMRDNGLDFEIIVVDDGSTDQTYNIAKSKHVKVYRPEKKGLGAAIKTGILKAKSDIVAILDADGSYPAEYLSQMFRFIPDYDQIIGKRSCDYGNLKSLRMATKKFIFGLASLLASQKIPDLNSGLRVFKKDLMMRYLHLIPDGFSCSSSMTLLFLYNGHAIKYFPIEYRKRIGESKFNISKDTWIMFWTVIRLSLTMKFRGRCS
jgi:glycosyltransferase involved in cell wall biosynthesis